MLPTADTLYRVIENTWPPATAKPLGLWIIRDGQNGGKRVSAATSTQPVTLADLPQAEAAMAALNQPALFQIREGDEALDALLASQGYTIIDPVVLYAAPIAPMAETIPDRLTGIAAFPPLAIAAELWAEGGIGAGRLAVMDRAQCTKTTLLGRVGDLPAGVLYMGIDQDCAMVHAVEVAEKFRRQGVANRLMAHAANWAKERGAKFMTLVTTADNAASNRLYQNLSMEAVGHYHYRIKSTLPKESTL